MDVATIATENDVTQHLSPIGNQVHNDVTKESTLEGSNRKENNNDANNESRRKYTSSTSRVDDVEKMTWLIVADFSLYKT